MVASVTCNTQPNLQICPHFYFEIFTLSSSADLFTFCKFKVHYGNLVKKYFLTCDIIKAKIRNFCRKFVNVYMSNEGKQDLFCIVKIVLKL